MEKDWQPVATLSIGHYAVGLIGDGQEAGIFHAGPGNILDTATGLAIFIAAWRPRKHGPSASGNLPLTHDRTAARDAVLEKARENPIVAEALRLFPGAELSADDGDT